MAAQNAPARADRALAAGVFLATALVMAATHRPVGHVRDEGYYFTAAEAYEGWFVQVGRDFARGRFLEPFRDETIVRFWEYNREHPPIAKTAYALSHLVFHRWLGWLDDVAAWRLPAFLFAGLLSLALFRLARPYGRTAALLAPLLFWTAPRHFFHAHLAAFDIPIAALWLLFLDAYLRAVAERRGAWKAGVVFGLALATKHNALFLPFVVVAHWLVTERPWRGGLGALLSRVPAPALAMAILGPLVLYVSWPFLWHHPIDRASWWISFHTHHVHYPWQYLGEVLREPPFPWAYPVVLEGLTLAATTLVLLAAAAAWLVAGAAGELVPAVRARAGRLDGRGWMLLLGTGAALLPFMTTRVPIFGGVKHWLAAVALLCVPAAALLVQAARALPGRSPRAATALLAALALAPAVWHTARFHPWGTSAYNELAGGAAGGAALGMQRQYWSNNVTAVLPWINEHAPRNALVYLHEVNQESFAAYQRGGLIRRDIRYAWGVPESVVAAYQYHQEFRDREFEIWSAYGTRTPALTFAVDEAPQVVVYARDR